MEMVSLSQGRLPCPGSLVISRVLPHRISPGRPSDDPVRQVLVPYFMGEKTGTQRVTVTCPLVGVQRLVSRGDTQTVPQHVTWCGWGEISSVVEPARHAQARGTGCFARAARAPSMAFNSPGHWTKARTLGVSLYLSA